jgi:hypothetical protein
LNALRTIFFRVEDDIAPICHSDFVDAPLTFKAGQRLLISQCFYDVFPGSMPQNELIEPVP